MEVPQDYYKSSLAGYSKKLVKVKRELIKSSVLRLSVFLIGVFGIYIGYGNLKTVTAIVVAVLCTFIYLVFRHNKLIYEKKFISALIEQNNLELQVLSGFFKNLPNGIQFDNPEHPFSRDIDLFGKGSFFQYLNRTKLEESTEFLAALLLKNDPAGILAKQEAIQELAQMPEWRQHFSATASLVKTEVSTAVINQWIREYKPFVPKWMGIVGKIFSVVSFAVIAAYFMDFVSGYLVAGWFGFGLIISGRYLKKVNQLSADTSGIQSTFDQFQQLLLKIEGHSFQSKLLSEMREKVTHNNKRTSWLIQKFARHLDALDQRSNMLFGILGNGFLLWDLQQSLNIEKWILNCGENVPEWFEAIVHFEAYNSLANFAFNHPSYVYPELTESPNLLEVQNAGHPLLNEETMVRNDFKIEAEQFFIITGANMAGKSTFLRTVSLIIVMGNAGLPICATQAAYTPIKLITSMRTTDSLTDDESYFFSELKRLKFIIDKIEKDRYFIILDEILKGTNSTDKAIGSKKFVEKLVKSRSTGIIATHDLSLCEVADELPEVKNYYFDAQIIDDELSFDYKFKEGICRNMNASFLLKKMKIVD